ncbi:MAG: S-layer homology domain-containing protein [Armatimonadota bacterium]|nr:S-layer homology domain-containing protein [Armatimonadota bacterium]MDR7520121.1 S-layer homology domain-containing protein [Armatimonadota bacterium]MDR7549402.1 S-layer homology domain-containing protein [Armatimonadota bacterium]
MKQLAVVLAAVLSFTLVAPALAQPFADVPTDHWAYDAIAELAAKGLVEGYPDGAFRGDRAMTRYEMAMVVARLLARIEAIKIPPLPPDLVRRAELTKTDAATRAALTAVDKRLTAKLATIQRLVAEFRAELAALGVRVTAVEEELAALRGRLDHVKITGDMRYRYNVFPSNTPSGSATVRSPDARLRGRLTFTSQPTANPNVTAVIRLRADNTAGAGPGGIADTRFGNTLVFQTVSFDLMYLDVRNTWGADLWRIGRQAYSIAPYGFGGGLLFDPGNSAGAVIGFTSGVNDGLRSDWTFGPIKLEVGLWRDNLLFACPAPPGITTTGLCTQSRYWDYKTVRATTTALLPGWTLGGTYYDQGQFNPSDLLTFFAVGRGWGADLSGTLIPGVTLYIDWASYTARWENTAATLVTYPAATAWRVGGRVDLERVAGISTWSPMLDWAYQNYGPMPFDAGTGLVATPPFYTYGTTVFGQTYAWNMRGWVGRLSLTLSPRTSFFAHYEGGTVLTAVPGTVETSYYEWWLRLTHRLSANLTGYIQYTKGHCDRPAAGPAPVNPNCPGSTTPAFFGDIFNFYRAELTYSW